MVKFANFEEIRNFPVDVVQYLDARRLLMEQNLRASRERLDIRRVRREYLNDPFGETVFAAYVAQGASGYHLSVGNEQALRRSDSLRLRPMRSMGLRVTGREGNKRWRKLRGANLPDALSCRENAS